eukprot:PhM_4_TR6915/c0_g1_i1/m.74939/K20404/DEPDC5; DEP domain-containing protein 5
MRRRHVSSYGGKPKQPQDDRGAAPQPVSASRGADQPPTFPRIVWFHNDDDADDTTASGSSRANSLSSSAQHEAVINLSNVTTIMGTNSQGSHSSSRESSCLLPPEPGTQVVIEIFPTGNSHSTNSSPDHPPHSIFVQAVVGTFGRENLQLSLRRRGGAAAAVLSASQSTAGTTNTAAAAQHRIVVRVRLHYYPAPIVTVPQSRHLTHVELHFKDAFWSRSDMWLIARRLLNTAVASMARLRYDGHPMTAVRVVTADPAPPTASSVSSGLVTEDTRFTFTSLSCVAVWLFQLSREMWEFDVDENNQKSGGYLRLDRAIDGLVCAILQKWKQQKAQHMLYVVLYARVHQPGAGETEDAYKDCIDVVLVARDPSDYDRIPHLLRQACVRLVQILIGVATFPPPPISTTAALFSTASRGNTLQAVNLALSLFNGHQINRDLRRTGHMLVVITAGVGHVAAEYVLKQITAQRLAEIGTVAQMLCVARPPLHVVPLIEFSGNDDDLRQGTPRHRIQRGRLYYESPPSFFSVKFYCVGPSAMPSGCQLWTQRQWWDHATASSFGSRFVRMPKNEDYGQLVDHHGVDLSVAPTQCSMPSTVAAADALDADAVLCRGCAATGQPISSGQHRGTGYTCGNTGAVTTSGGEGSGCESLFVNTASRQKTTRRRDPHIHPRSSPTAANHHVNQQQKLRAYSRSDMPTPQHQSHGQHHFSGMTAASSSLSHPTGQQRNTATTFSVSSLEPVSSLSVSVHGPPPVGASGPFPSSLPLSSYCSPSSHRAHLPQSQPKSCPTVDFSVRVMIEVTATNLEQSEGGEDNNGGEDDPDGNVNSSHQGLVLEPLDFVTHDDVTTDNGVVVDIEQLPARPLWNMTQISQDWNGFVEEHFCFVRPIRRPAAASSPQHNDMTTFVVVAPFSGTLQQAHQLALVSDGRVLDDQHQHTLRLRYRCAPPFHPPLQHADEGDAISDDEDDDDIVTLAFRAKRSAYYCESTWCAEQSPAPDDVGGGVLVPLFSIHPQEPEVFRFKPINPFEATPTKINHCQASNTVSNDAGCFDGRWAHLIPDDSDDNDIDANWVPLCRQVLYPLTTSSGMMDAHVYDEKPHHPILTTESSDQQQQQVQEMILQRLVQSYQYVGAFSHDKRTHELTTIGQQQVHVITVCVDDGLILVRRFEHRSVFNHNHNGNATVRKKEKKKQKNRDTKEATSTFSAWNHRTHVWDAHTVVFSTVTAYGATGNCAGVSWSDVDTWIADVYCVPHELPHEIPYKDPSARARTMALAILPAGAPMTANSGAFLGARHTDFATRAREAKLWHDALDTFLSSEFCPTFRVADHSGECWHHDLDNTDYVWDPDACRKEAKGVCLVMSEDVARARSPDRRQWFHISIAHGYNPHAFLTFQIYWLHCAGHNIQEWIAGMRQHGRSRGYQIVQIPFQEHPREVDPFQRMAVFPLDPLHPMYNVGGGGGCSVKYQSIENQPEQQHVRRLFYRYVVQALMDQDYYPESLILRPPLRLLHLSGDVIVQMLDDRAVFIANYLHPSPNKNEQVRVLFAECRLAVRAAVHRTLFYIEYLEPIISSVATSNKSFDGTCSFASTTTNPSVTHSFGGDATMFLDRAVFFHARSLPGLCQDATILVDCQRPAHDEELASIPGSYGVDEGLLEELATQCIATATLPPPRSVLSRCRTLRRIILGCDSDEEDGGNIPPSPFVLLFDEDGRGLASVVWWMLTALGCKDVHILDGGRRAWLTSGCPVPEISRVVRKKPLATPANSTPFAVRRNCWSLGNDPNEEGWVLPAVATCDPHQDHIVTDCADNVFGSTATTLDVHTALMTVFGRDVDVHRWVVDIHTPSTPRNHDLATGCRLVAMCHHVRCGLPSLLIRQAAK